MRNRGGKIPARYKAENERTTLREEGGGSGLNKDRAEPPDPHSQGFLLSRSTSDGPVGPENGSLTAFANSLAKGIERRTFRSFFM